MSKARIMYEMTVKEIREGLKETQTVILPVGVVEQHGYHLPISVDIHNACEVAIRASEETGCFVAPVVHYNFSGGMLPGTINISPQVFSLLLMDILRSLVVQGFRNIIIYLGHGGTEANRAARDAAEIFQRLDPRNSDVVIAFLPIMDASPTMTEAIRNGDYHAALIETSLMLYWKPELVKLDQAQYDSDEILRMMRENPDAYLQARTGADSKYVVPQYTQHPGIEVGVMGRFEGASAELGRKVAGELVATLVETVRQLEAGSRS